MVYPTFLSKLQHPLKFSFFLLFLLISLPVPSVHASQFTDIRVGLYFDDTVMTSANLANENGSGFRFGYYTDKINFVELGQTSETSITMVIGNNVYLSGSTYYTSPPSSNAPSLGCFHVIHSRGYDSYNQAKETANQVSQGFVAYIQGEFQVRTGAFLTREEANDHAWELGLSDIVGTSGYSINIVKMSTTELIFQFDSGKSTGLGVIPDISGHSDPQTWFKNMLYRGGFQYQRVTQGDLTVSNILPLETYVKGVIPYEMSPSWPLEALKTQAVCARTYGAMQILRVNHASSNFDLCNTAHCQVYRGLGGPSTANPSVTSDTAVNETADMYLWHNGSLAGTYYSSSHGGASEAVSNVWTSSNQSSYPYLSGVIDPYEHLASNVNSRSSWTVSFTHNELLSMLQSKGYGTTTDILQLECIYSDTGNVISLVVHWENGKTNSISPTELRYTSWFALPSIHFVINRDLPKVTNFLVDSNPHLSAGATGNVTTTTTLGYKVNQTSLISSLESLFSLSTWGEKNPLVSKPYVITGSGTVTELTPNYEETKTESSGGSYEGAEGVTYDLEIITGSYWVDRADNYHFNGAGWGHNIGMSQFGAYAMALHMGFSYDYILEFYFPGTVVGSP